MSEPRPLTSAIALLRDLRQELDTTTSADWTSRSHADVDAMTFIHLAIGNVGAIESLAAAGQQFVIPATAAARTAFEFAATAAWLVGTDDMAERERRWLGLFIEERRFWQAVRDEGVEHQYSAESLTVLQGEIDRVTAIVNAVQPQLKAFGAADAERIPTVDKRLESIGHGERYVLYRQACQIVHPANKALSQARDLIAAHSAEEPTLAIAYRTTDHDWKTAIHLGAESLALCWDTRTNRLQGPRITSRAVVTFNSLMAWISGVGGQQGS